MGYWCSGTVLDRVVTHPSEMDFFLLSQAGLKGTSRPTYYQVILDQNQLTPDDIQSFAHQYACSRSGSCTWPELNQMVPADLFWFSIACF